MGKNKKKKRGSKKPGKETSETPSTTSQKDGVSETTTPTDVTLEETKDVQEITNVHGDVLKEETTATDTPAEESKAEESKAEESKAEESKDAAPTDEESKDTAPTDDSKHKRVLSKHQKAKQEKYGVLFVDMKNVKNCTGCSKKLVWYPGRVSKYHCRKCGQVFCNGCTKTKLLIKGSKNKKRICDGCVADGCNETNFDAETCIGHSSGEEEEEVPEPEPTKKDTSGEDAKVAAEAKAAKEAKRIEAERVETERVEAERVEKARLAEEARLVEEARLAEVARLKAVEDIRLAEVARLKVVEDARVAMVAANIECLKRGIAITKHPRKGAPQERVLWLTQDCTQFCIAKKVTATVTSKTKGWYVKDELDPNFKVIKGCNSAVFARTTKLKSSKYLIETCCMTVSLPDRTIDLQFASEDMLDKITDVIASFQ